MKKDFDSIKSFLKRAGLIVFIIGLYGLSTIKTKSLFEFILLNFVVIFGFLIYLLVPLMEKPFQSKL